MQLEDFMTHLQGAKGGPVQYTARCPAHRDRHNSLSVGLGEDGRILLKCHAGCETTAVLVTLGLRAADLFPESGDKPAGTRSASAAVTLAPVGPCVKGKSLPGTAREAGKSSPSPVKRIHGETDLQKCKFSEVLYPYFTADGKLLFEVVRRQFEDGSKGFLQRRPGGKGEFLYNLKGITPVLYRLPQILLGMAAGETVVLCEGEKDVDALVSLGLCATTAPMGAGKWREEYTESLRNARQVLVAPDNDKPGRAHALAVCTSLAAAGVPVQVADIKALYPALPRKGDVSDVLAVLGPAAAERLTECAVPPEQFAEIAENRDALDDAMPYAFATSADYLKKTFWEDIARSARREGLSTGFKGLDAQFDGRLYPGLFVVGSVSSLGKTAFCLQMADAIAAQGTDVLFFTLEMSRMEMVARSLTRLLFARDGFTGGASVGHVLHGRVPEAELLAAAQAYQRESAGHIAFVEGDFGLGVAQVREKVTLHHAGTGRRPVVFVDYLQILRPPDVRMSDKQATDYNVIELKRLSRDLDVPVIAVSSFNRQNYADEVNMASFKESGAIEYSADFVLGLQARGVSSRADDTPDEKKLARMVKGETKSAKKQDPRPIEVVTLKNRRGPAWAVFDLDFYPRQNYFAEV